MIDAMIGWASTPETAMFVLVGSVAILVVEAARQSRVALWGDFFAEDLDEE